jgi:hypothetical protein
MIHGFFDVMIDYCLLIIIKIEKHMWKVWVMWESLGRCFMELFAKMYNLCITNSNRQSSISFRNWGHTPNGP